MEIWLLTAAAPVFLSSLLSSFIFYIINGDRKSQEFHLRTCIQFHTTKHPSQKAMNFRHLLYRTQEKSFTISNSYWKTVKAVLENSLLICSIGLTLCGTGDYCAITRLSRKLKAACNLVPFGNQCSLVPFEVVYLNCFRFTLSQYHP